MSTSVDQRAKGEVSVVSNKETEYAYMPQQPQQAGYPAGSSTVPDPYGFMSGYYPYYAMPDEMTAAAGVWSAGDVASSAAMTYGYSPVGADYGAMMAEYGYAGIGWFPSNDGSGWGTAPGVPGGVKDDQGNAYASASGYYAMEQPMAVYGGAPAGPAQQAQHPQENSQRDLEVAGIEQGMQSMNVNGGRHASGEYENKDTGRGGSSVGGVTGASKSWASVAGQHSYASKSRGGQPPFPRAPIHSGKMQHDGGAWENRAAGDPGRQAHDGWSASRRRPTSSAAPPSTDAGSLSPTVVQQNQYNPKEFDLNPKAARFFIIKSYAEDDIHRSIKYGIWCSTEYGNKRLDAAYREREGKGPIFLFFSVNGSGHFCGVAQMISAVDYQSSVGVWAQDKWKGKFEVKWIYVKDVPNSQLRHIRLENNEGKPVTNSRDTQEVPPDKGCQVLRVIHQYRHTTSIFDDFSHYEKRQEEEDAVKK